MNTSTNIGKILKNALADVLAGKYYLIVSEIETNFLNKLEGPVKRYKRPKRVCFYITPNVDPTVNSKFAVHRHIFLNTKRNPVLDEIDKYQIVGNWGEDAERYKIIHIGAFSRRWPDPDYFNVALRFFLSKNIDTVCTIDIDTKKPIELVYDRIGKAHIARQFRQNARKWSNIRTNAEREFDPSVFFEQPEQKELLEQMKKCPGNTVQYFGKRKPKRKNDELTKINSLIAQISKVLK